MSNVEGWNSDCGLRIADLGYSACRELLGRTVYFIMDRAQRYLKSAIQNLKSKIKTGAQTLI
ncbi:hypothetical protein JY97_07535 [Alkalispirochaeta odontotermitis]|nr:hypothetical protein JY97_07535 [Alkalispirochaeta odontotermitis]CAB1083694.1 hypothetical protein D1AOALGA4SA_11236 [Olavius algarvensis Delta 1 endosymbiont]